MYRTSVAGVNTINTDKFGQVPREHRRSAIYRRHDFTNSQVDKSMCHMVHNTTLFYTNDVPLHAKIE